MMLSLEVNFFIVLVFKNSFFFKMFFVNIKKSKIIEVMLLQFLAFVFFN